MLILLIYIIFVVYQLLLPSVCRHIFVVVVVVVVYLNDPDSYAGWSFVLLLGLPKSNRLKDRGQTK